jgi:anti-anti-sigma regulatory factor
MLRIEAQVDADQGTTIRATGKLSGPWVAELQRSIASRDRGSVLVDLTDVSFVDRDGLEYLRSLAQERRISLRCSAFVTAQLM